MQPAEDTQALLKQMLNKSLFVAIRTPVDLSRFGELLDVHLRWAIAAERRGELFASGPFVAGQAAPGSLGGMSILRAANLDEARKIIESDPFIESGVFAVSLHNWMLMEGSFSINVRFSNQHYSLM